jgi:hypothetical protein
VATTASEIFTGGYATSSKNNPGEIATEATELLRVLNQRLRKWFAFIARENWTLIGDSVLVGYDGAVSGWHRPANAELVARIEKVTGVEVVLVPTADRVTAEPTLPAVHRLGQVYFSCGNVNDPVPADSLWFYIAKQPTTLVAASSTIDSRWPESFNPILETELGVYLARKDNRVEELAALSAELDDWSTMLQLFCEHESINERRRFDLTNKFVATRQRAVAPRGEQQ